MSAAPFDPFQSRRTAVIDSIQKLGERWVDIVHEYNTRPKLDLVADDAESCRLWEERKEVEKQIFAIAEPTIGGIALKLRIAAWYSEIESDDCLNNIISALADAERLRGAT